jgi:Putative zinc-finger
MGEDRGRPSRCGGIRESLPEVALGTASEDDRAAVLLHLAECESCRGELAALTDVAGDLLTLVPPREPPASFDDRVLRRFEQVRAGRPRHGARHRRSSRRRGRRVIAIAAALLVAVIVGAAGAYLVDADERNLADRYRAALTAAQGQYFVAEPLVDSAGGRVGHVFGYQGRPSWVFVGIPEPVGTAVEVTAVSRDGARTSLGTIGPSSRGAGFVLEGDLHQVGVVEVVGDGSTWRATFPAQG